MWWTSVVVRVERIMCVDDYEQALTSTGGGCFCDGIGIPAETASYDFSLGAEGIGRSEWVDTATNIVAGDVYLVEGQSNAEARSFNGSANGNQDLFVRTFGTGADTVDGVQSNVDWHMAEGDLGRNNPGRVGQWPLRMGRRLRDQTGIPIAILNGAHGGKAIGFFQRNDVNPVDLNTNYGRLLWRAHMAGVANRVRGLLWYQGEGDRRCCQPFYGFSELQADWIVDYSAIEQFFVFQLREGQALLGVVWVSATFSGAFRISCLISP